MVSLNSRKGRDALKGPKFVISYTATEEEAEKSRRQQGQNSLNRDRSVVAVRENDDWVKQ